MGGKTLVFGGSSVHILLVVVMCDKFKIIETSLKNHSKKYNNFEVDSKLSKLIGLLIEKIPLQFKWKYVF